MAYVQACPVEINGFGYLDRFTGDTERFELEDVVILQQTATGASVDVSAEVLAQHMTQILMAGGDTGRMRLQWHSHVLMSAYFSNTDLANIEAYSGEWMISIVLNKRGEYDLRLDVYKPFRAWTPLKLVITTQPSPELAAACARDIADKVRILGTFRVKPVKPTPVGAISVSPDNLMVQRGES